MFNQKILNTILNLDYSPLIIIFKYTNYTNIKEYIDIISKKINPISVFYNLNDKNNIKDYISCKNCNIILHFQENNIKKILSQLNISIEMINNNNIKLFLFISNKVFNEYYYIFSDTIDRATIIFTI